MDNVAYIIALAMAAIAAYGGTYHEALSAQDAVNAYVHRSTCVIQVSDNVISGVGSTDAGTCGH